MTAARRLAAILFADVVVRVEGRQSVAGQGWGYGQSDPRAGSRSSSHPIRDF